MQTNTNTLFEQATRAKLRFPIGGNIGVEDLWDVSLEDLDDCYKGLNATVKESQEDSLLANTTTPDTTTILKRDVIKHVVTTRLQEAEAKKNAAANKARKQKLLAIVARKQEAELEGLSTDKLNEMINELN